MIHHDIFVHTNDTFWLNYNFRTGIIFLHIKIALEGLILGPLLPR